MTAAESIGRWIAGLRPEEVPAEVLRVARDCIIDTAGVALAATGAEAAQIARRYAVETFAAGRAELFAGGSGLVAQGAALANAAAAHALDFDDNSYAGFVHGSAVVVPAALAACQAAGGTGEDLLGAVIAGAEVEYAVAEAAGNAVYRRGWWTTALFGVIGAAAAAARATRLDGRQAGHAVALAACAAGGLRACLGSLAKPLLAGQAAQLGVQAAGLARLGADGPAAVFEEPRGFGRIVATDGFAPEPCRTLGRTWRLLVPGVDVKKYPVCLSGHAAADGVLDILREEGLAAAEVASVRCRVPPVVAANLTYDRPATPDQARFSLPFAVGCMLAFGDIALCHLSPGTLADPVLRTAMEKVTMTVRSDWDDDPDLARQAPEGAEVELIAADGRRFRRLSRAARGTRTRPLEAAEFAAKFLSCCGPVVGPGGAEELLARLRRLDRMADLTGLLVVQN